MKVTTVQVMLFRNIAACATTAESVAHCAISQSKMGYLWLQSPLIVIFPKNLATEVKFILFDKGNEELFSTN